MTVISKTKAVAGLLLFGLVCLTGRSLPAQDEEPNEALIQMIVDLVGGDDPDMRTLGLQQIREEIRGEAATKRFVELLPKLPPADRVSLLDALGDRGDTAARAAVIEMLKEQPEEVRAAALGALGALGSAADVPMLTEKAAAGSEPERHAARQSLIRLRGDDVNDAVVSEMKESEAAVRAKLLEVLAGRNATGAVPTVIESAEDADPAVRLAALGALRALADEGHVADIVRLLGKCEDDAQRLKAELALLVICSRGRESCAKALIDGLADAGAPSRVVLLRALGRAGGADALKTLVESLKDDDEAVRTEAVRVLSGWGDPAVAPHLLEIARSDDQPRFQILAIRGLMRLGSARKDKPADMKLLAEAMGLAKRPQETRMAVGVLGRLGTPEALALVVPVLDDLAVAEEAGLAAVMIAEKIKDGDKDMIRTAMGLVQKQAKDQDVRQRAEKVLKSL